MDLELLPRDLQYEYFNRLDYPEIESLCQSNRYFRNLCNTPSFQQLISNKKRFAIPITKTPIKLLTFLNSYGFSTAFNIHVPKPGSLVRVFRGSTPYVVLNSKIDAQATFQRGQAIITPVYRTSNGYAIINPQDPPEKLSLINFAINQYSWIDDHYTHPVEFI